MKKILITGGHISPALAFLDALPKDQYDPVFVGRMSEFDGDRAISQEFRLINNRGIRFIPLIAGRLTRRFSIRTFLALLKIPIGFFQACSIMLRERPYAIISFGGYVALPVAIAGWFSRVPIITHEQTRVPGLANRLIGSFARIICVSFAQTALYFPKMKTVVTGLPMRSGLFNKTLKPAFMPNSDLPIVYITGGTTGAVSMNNKLFPLIAKLTLNNLVVHQTGMRSEEFAQSIKEGLTEEARHRYIPISYIDESDVFWILQNAKLIIARSGANTVMELGALGKVAVFIPLPWSGGGEQYINALFLKDAGSAEIVDQTIQTSDALLACIEMVLKGYSSYHRHALSVSKTIPRDGAARMVLQLVRLGQ